MTGENDAMVGGFGSFVVPGEDSSDRRDILGAEDIIHGVSCLQVSVSAMGFHLQVAQNPYKRGHLQRHCSYAAEPG